MIVPLIIEKNYIYYLSVKENYVLDYILQSIDINSLSLEALTRLAENPCAVDIIERHKNRFLNIINLCFNTNIDIIDTVYLKYGEKRLLYNESAYAAKKCIDKGIVNFANPSDIAIDYIEKKIDYFIYTYEFNNIKYNPSYRAFNLVRKVKSDLLYDMVPYNIYAFKYLSINRENADHEYIFLDNTTFNSIILDLNTVLIIYNTYLNGSIEEIIDIETLYSNVDRIQNKYYYLQYNKNRKEIFEFYRYRNSENYNKHSIYKYLYYPTYNYYEMKRIKGPLCSEIHNKYQLIFK